MTAREREKINKFISAVSSGVGDRCGCNDNDHKRTEDWATRFFTTKVGIGFDGLLDDVTEAVAYGG